MPSLFRCLTNMGDLRKLEVHLQAICIVKTTWRGLVHTTLLREFSKENLQTIDWLKAFDERARGILVLVLCFALMGRVEASPIPTPSQVLAEAMKAYSEGLIPFSTNAPVVP